MMDTACGHARMMLPLLLLLHTDENPPGAATPPIAAQETLVSRLPPPTPAAAEPAPAKAQIKTTINQIQFNQFNQIVCNRTPCERTRRQ